MPAAPIAARRIALVGLRGAGKSTLGRMLAQHLGWPFIELDRVVEEDYGVSVPDLIEMAGTATFRRHERSALERVIAAHEAAVITTAGGIVSNPETYALLLRRTHTIWIKARPEDHMSRVMAQGDFRPMAQNRGANPKGRWPIWSRSSKRAAPTTPAPKPRSTRRATPSSRALPNFCGS